MARELRAAPARSLSLHGPGLDRRVRDLATWPRAQGRGGRRRCGRAARGRAPRRGRGRTWRAARRGRGGAARSGGADRAARRGGDHPGAGRGDGALPRSLARHALSPASSRSSSSGRSRRAPPGTSCSRARPRLTGATARSATPRRGSTTSPSWASTSLYLPPIHPIGARVPQGAGQPPRRRARRSGQPVGDRRGRGRPHQRAPASSARSTTSIASSPRRARAGSRSRSTSRSRPRPITRGSRSTRAGSGRAPTARSSTPRTRRRSTRTSIRSTSRARTGAALWAALRDVFVFWAARGVRVFRVDNPHTKPIPFWEWCLREVHDALPRRDLPRRGVHAPEADVRARQGWLLAVVHVLHVAHDASPS